MFRLGVGIPIKAVIRQKPWSIIGTLTLSLSTLGHLTINGKTLSLNAVAAVTKVSFAIKQAWDNALYDSETSISFGVFTYSGGVIGSKITDGNSETTDVNGLIEIATTAVGRNIGDTVIVVFWKAGAGPSGADIIGASFQQLVAGP